MGAQGPLCTTVAVMVVAVSHLLRGIRERAEDCSLMHLNITATLPEALFSSLVRDKELEASSQEVGEPEFDQGCLSLLSYLP